MDVNRLAVSSGDNQSFNYAILNRFKIVEMLMKMVWKNVIKTERPAVGLKPFGITKIEFKLKQPNRSS